MRAADYDKDRISGLGDTVVDHTYKGIPLGERITISEIASRRWNVARGDLALPVMTLGAPALASNLKTMQAYCERHGALLAPHGKTTMSPQLFARQIDRGAWAMTVATPTQVAVMREYGISRIILANELADPSALRWIASEVARDAAFDFYCLVDSPETVRDMDSILASVTPEVRVSVLLEIGIRQGRGGVRTVDEAVAVAREVARSKHTVLVGVEAYEGLVTGGGSQEDIEKLNSFFADMRDVVRTLAEARLFGTDRVIVTAGGSSYFDRVVAELSDWEGLPAEVQLVLRSGCYLSHDGGKYEKLSPLAGRRTADEPLRLVNGLRAWAEVLSRPEPDLVILGIGKRDVAFDLTLPVPRAAFRRDGSVADLRAESEIFRLMDQHAFVRVRPQLRLKAGDIVSMDVSHPCTAFDKYKLLPVIDEDNTVVDAVLTFF